ncbi:molybdenum cofactor biosynthesis protein MoaE [Hyphobacterium marinum]|uniref:Molybdopterin synthase catalytic subunit n=1 Tax=Hyphobacterium marinum TaxID=3116574 RepID=A0ABU7LV92_9PROT|nr:molybdenum cofactor biosynthesis protein MoaE [Hyphobacterium sp. Y6023]MEE2565172.1 molybdenum cofactor biosynthesis protein MoaE [Hyphobacterium sp. Y6023]
MIAIPPIEIEIVDTNFDPAARLAGFAGPESGAVASFTGQVRGGSDTVLTLEHYPGVTEAALRSIAETAHQRWPLDRSLVIHRVGAMWAGEAIVLVACASAHRRAALEACAFLIDVLKTEAPFWKKEADGTGERWVETGTADQSAARDWLEETGS